MGAVAPRATPPCAPFLESMTLAPVASEDFEALLAAGKVERPDGVPSARPASPP